MTTKCKQIGCKTTNFKNPHGLDENDHYLTAYDMSLIASELIKHKDILKITSTYEENINVNGQNHWLVNTNKLVRFYEDVDGLKTGYTKDAGYCLTATAKKNNMRLISVVMKVDSETHRTSDTVKLLNYGFSNYKLNMIFKKGTVVDKIKIDNSKNEYINVVLKDNAFDLINVNDNNKDYSYNIKLNKITLPIKKNSIIGKLEIIDNEGNTLNNVNLIVKEDILKANIFDYIKRNIRELVNGKKLI
jgi:D-alanyl-D-alanine carboxypeptidase (penicillin-binding protein 5/6)